ncbi:MAG: VTT domain-containing protein [Candidatus Aenigmatarchaeota archaeon]|nr:MAG: VTT domain-containing protein [Candidatus Aenigmarchaeota archaeon]
MDSSVKILLLGVVLIFLYASFRTGTLGELAAPLTERSTPISGLIASVTQHVTSADAVGVGLYAFASRLFFLPLPLEPYIAYAYGTGTNFLVLALAVAAFGTIGSAVTYAVGRFLGRYVVKEGKWKRRAERVKDSKFVSPAIFLAALLPLPEVVGLVFGAVRISLNKYMVYTFAGLAAKTLLLVLLFDYLKQYLQFAI